MTRSNTKSGDRFLAWPIHILTLPSALLLLHLSSPRMSLAASFTYDSVTAVCGVHTLITGTPLIYVDSLSLANQVGPKVFFYKADARRNFTVTVESSQGFDGTPSVYMTRTSVSQVPSSENCEYCSAPQSSKNSVSLKVLPLTSECYAIAVESIEAGDQFDITINENDKVMSCVEQFPNEITTDVAGDWKSVLPVSQFFSRFYYNSEAGIAFDLSFNSSLLQVFSSRAEFFLVPDSNLFEQVSILRFGLNSVRIFPAKSECYAFAVRRTFNSSEFIEVSFQQIASDESLTSSPGAPTSVPSGNSKRFTFRTLFVIIIAIVGILAVLLLLSVIRKTKRVNFTFSEHVTEDDGEIKEFPLKDIPSKV